MKEQSRTVLPSGWIWTSLGALKKFSLYGPRFSSDDYRADGYVVLRTSDISEGGKVDISNAPRLSLSEDEFAKYAVEPGDLLITRTGSLGTLAVFNDNVAAIPGAYLILFRISASMTTSWYVFHFLKSAAGQAALVGGGAGVGRPNINAPTIEGIPIPLAPIGEQQRIIAAIEQHLSDIDAGIGAIERALANLKRYRASVLKAACEGRLVPTEAELARKEKRDYEPADVLLRRILKERRTRWEADQLAKMKAKGQAPKDDRWKAKYEEPQLPDARPLSALPDGWCWTFIDSLSWGSGYGTSEKCDYDGSGPPVLRIPNIIDGSISLEDLKYACSGDGLVDLQALSDGDLLVIRTNGSRDLIGRAGLVTATLSRPHFFASYLIRFRIIQERSLPRWVSLAWSAPITRQQVIAGAATSAGQYNVSLSSLAVVPIPLPPLAEQRRIVAEVDRLLSTADETEQTLRAQLARAARLRQAVLKRAFEGKLVPQDPTDEPASALLARLRAQAPPEPTRAARGRPRRSARTSEP